MTLISTIISVYFYVYNLCGYPLNSSDLWLSIYRNKQQLRPASLPEMGIDFSLLKRFLYDPKGKGKSSKQLNFRQEIIHQYNLGMPDSTWIWDVVIGSYQHPRDMKAAYLISYAVPTEAVDYICGPGTGSRRFLWENGLMLCDTIEKYLGNGDIVIISVLSNNIRATEFMLKIAVTGLANKKFGPPHSQSQFTLQELDGRRLQWKNAQRPMLHFLYWRFIILMLGNRKNRPTITRLYYNNLKAAKPFMSFKTYLQKRGFINNGSRSWMCR